MAQWRGRRDLLSLAPLLMTGFSVPAAAQTWPLRPLRAVVGFAPGGGVDLAARVVTRRLAEVLGQQMVVENRPGAGSTVAAAYVARTEPDGYTLMVGETAMFTGPVLYPSARFDPVADFVPVMRMAVAPLGIAVPAALGVSDLASALDRARRAPSPWRYGTPGVGTAQHLVGEMLRQKASVPLEHVPYRGGAPAITALLAGEVEMAVASLPSLTAAVASSGVRLLSVSTAARVPGLAEVPVVAETIPGFDAAPGIFLLAPAGTPAPVVARLAQAGAEVGRDPAVGAALVSAGLLLGDTAGPAELAAEVAEETRRWSELARATGARLE